MKSNFQQAWTAIKDYLESINEDLDVLSDGLPRRVEEAIDVMDELNKRFTVLYIDRKDIADRFDLPAEKTFTDGMMQAIADMMFKNEYLLDEFYTDTLNFVMGELHNADPVRDEDDFPEELDDY